MHTCKTCAAFKPIGSANNMQGHCQLYPPSITVLHEPRSCRNSVDNRWPVVRESDGCLQHKPKEEANRTLPIPRRYSTVEEVEEGR